ncbi:hypothetical protein T4A_8760 [Trichinella pseudospiralis]|uniref:Uncharacterized protein n=1 Tax=Trichinella pseudospiralis TaxID=6337 RepID=A0A0V1EX14_TRIPS|nr:hypothetical protein T4A_8760 [Trichinella pseudospiralis]
MCGIAENSDAKPQRKFVQNFKYTLKRFSNKIDKRWLTSAGCAILAIQLVIALILAASLIIPHCYNVAQELKTVDDANDAPDDDDDDDDDDINALFVKKVCNWPLTCPEFSGQIFAAVAVLASMIGNILLAFILIFRIDRFFQISPDRLTIIYHGMAGLAYLITGTIMSWYAYDEKHFHNAEDRFYTQWIVATVCSFINFCLCTSEFVRQSVLMTRA